jgi:hypothetical protein
MEISMEFFCRVGNREFSSEKHISLKNCFTNKLTCIVNYIGASTARHLACIAFIHCKRRGLAPEASIWTNLSHINVSVNS